MIDPSIRELFPILKTKVHGHPLVYFDNAATTQKPKTVIDALSEYYTRYNANIHRGAHYLAVEATDRYEQVRQQVQTFIGAQYSDEIIFTRGTTESINLVASSFSKRWFTGNDEVIVSGMEHHSNIVPWQLCGARLRPIPFNEAGTLDINVYEQLFTKQTRIVAINHVSNTLGTINPINQIIDIAHSHGIPILIDGAQAISHIPINVQSLGCDFYCFSGHKMYGPMGVGVVYGRRELLEQMPPYQGGGEMISNVNFDYTSYNTLPFKFEAGTPSVGDILGLGRAIEFIQKVGLPAIANHEDSLLSYATDQLLQLDGIHIYGTAQQKTGVLSFLIHNMHPYDIGTLIDQMGIAVRTGHHCTQPIMNYYNIPGTIRASFAVYNTQSEIDTFISALKHAIQMLQ